MAIHYDKDQNGVVTLTMDMPNRSANVINREFGEALQEVLKKLEQEEGLKGIILTSAKKTFMAGGDLDWLINLEDPAIVFASAEELKGSFRKLETIGSPVIAALNGSALGGGLELALACHYRIAIDDTNIKFGFPEVSLGLIPGGGGIARGVRLLGLQNSIPFLMEGKRISPQEALKNGLIHELAQDREELIHLANQAVNNKVRDCQPWDEPGYRLPGGSPTRPKIAQMLAIAPAMLRKKTYGNYPAPEATMSAAVEGAMVDFPTASRIESRYFAKIATGKTAKNMINAFWFQLNEINAGTSRPGGIPPQKTGRVGVLGAGMMGHGIAYVTAYAGKNVVLKDISQSMAEDGKAAIQKIIAKRVAHGRMTQSQADEILSRIKPTSSAHDLQGCDLIIEAVFEDRELKANVTKEAEEFILDTAVFASNTSTLPISSLAARSSRPSNFVGLHFFSPVHKMKLVEIIRGEGTSAETLAKAFDFVREIGKIPIVVNDSRGFYTSRVFSTYVLEGMALLGEGQNPRAVESAGFKAGMPVGPLALTDEVSLSLLNHINDQTNKDLAAADEMPPYHPAHNVLERMTGDFNRQGKSFGAGFYEYPSGEQKYLWPALVKHFPLQDGVLSQGEMIERMMFIQAVETVRCLQEGILLSSADANIGSIFGWGFAPFKGGTLQYINDYGVAEFCARCQDLAAQYGERFEPPQTLIEKAGQGESF